MTAGRELDALVAEKVMGYVWTKETFRKGQSDERVWYILHDPADAGVRMSKVKGSLGLYEPSTLAEALTSPNWWRHIAYSTDIAAAWLVVEKLTDQKNSVDLTARPDSWSCTVAVRERGYFEEWAATAPLAICGAALMSVGAYTEPVGNLP